MISVCIATHNGAKYIKIQLDSILSQLSQDDEVVISDDGSIDGTLSVINQMDDSRIKVYQYNQPSVAKHAHEYVCRNFENALNHAHGNYIFLSDQDDEWLPNKIEVCIKDLQEHDLVLHDFMHVDETGNVIKHLHYNGSFRPKNFLMRNGKHFGCAMAFRREILDYILPFPKHLILHDFWIGILAESLGDFYFEQRALIKYRIHSENTSEVKNKLSFKLSYRFLTFFELFKRIIQYKLYSHSK